MSAQPDTLFHYTTADGLHGIVTSKSLWASDYKSLNDRSELKFGLNIISEYASSAFEQIREISPEAKMLVESLLIGGVDESTYAFVASLSAEKDLLSQWRGYNGGRGFSVGFSSEKLSRLAKDQRFLLAPVFYDEDKQIAGAKGAVHKLIEKLEDLEGDPTRVIPTVRQWWTRLALRLALTFKDNHFSEEAEWRLIHLDQKRHSGMAVRPVRQLLLPFLPFEISDAKAYKEVVIGPAMPANQEAAVRALFEKEAVDILVTGSAIPYVAN